MLLLAAATGAAILVWNGRIVVPSHYNPFAPLEIAAEPNLLTRFKLARLAGNPERCHAALHGTRLRFTPVPDRASKTGCGLQNAVQVARSGLRFNSACTATCPLAAAWMLFEIHVLQPAAERHFGRRVARIVHFGSYACRNRYGREAGRRSEHATANAIDVAAFVLADGTQISVGRDWNREAGGRAAFLRDVRNGACHFFDTVLSPDYNRAHRDHLHFDMGRFGVCR